MLPAEDQVRLRHMLDAARRAQRLIAGRSRETLAIDDALSLALQRLIEILGEAANRVTPETQERVADIPWRVITGMRNRLIHAYFDVDLDVLWNTVDEDLPPLIAALESLIGSTQSNGSTFVADR